MQLIDAFKGNGVALLCSWIRLRFVNFAVLVWSRSGHRSRRDASAVWMRRPLLELYSRGASQSTAIAWLIRFTGAGLGRLGSGGHAWLRRPLSVRKFACRLG